MKSTIKNSSSIILLLIILFVFTTSVTAQEEPTLLAYYPFSEGSGTTTADATGNHSDATIVGSVGWVTGSPVGDPCLNFHGPDNRKEVVLCGSFPDLDAARNNAGFTVSLWFTKAHITTQSGGSWGGLISQRPYPHYNWQFYENLHPNGHNDWIYGPRYETCVYVVPEAGKWYHLLATYQPNRNPKWKIYINGNQTFSSNNIGRSGGDLDIGNLNDGYKGYNSSWDGLIDDVSIWEGVLTPEQIQALASGESPEDVAGGSKDSDGDGVLDEEDACPDTEEGALVDEFGCSIDQYCPCDDDWKNHGAYVNCVAHTAEEFLEAGLITEAEKDAIVSAAARSDCGKKKKKGRPKNIGELSTEGETVIPEDYLLSQNYPNPFNPTTGITFALPKAETVKLSVYNTSGQLIRTLVNGFYSEGFHTVMWDATDEAGNRVTSGMYMYVLHAGETVLQNKMLLMK